jgi:LPS-assembly lipoprotein
VETEDGRTNYMVGTALRDRLGTWGGDGADYVLRTRSDLSRTGQALRLDQVATRILLVTNVSYGLYDNRSGRLLTQGAVTGVATYDVPAEPYAAIRAEQDSEQRAAQEAADRVTIELAGYFREANAAADSADAAPGEPEA